MPPRVLLLPPRFDLDGLRFFLARNDLSRDPSIDRLIIENRDLDWIEPVGLAALCATLCLLRWGREEQCPVEFTTRRHVDYLQRMDVFRQAGVALTEHFRRWPSGGRFVELSAMQSPGEVDTVAERLMRVLPSDPDLRKFFHYCLAELLNNTFQHAMSQVSALTCAQTWRGTRMQGQIAVVDCGVGLRAALRTNPALQPADDLEALALAMRPWTSGRAHLRGPYAETGTKGNGLFMIRRLIESVGGRLLISSKAGLRDLTRAGQVALSVGIWPGTLVALQFPLRLPADWWSLLRPIWRELNEAPKG